MAKTIAKNVNFEKQVVSPANRTVAQQFCEPTRFQDHLAFNRNGIPAVMYMLGIKNAPEFPLQKGQTLREYYETIAKAVNASEVSFSFDKEIIDGENHLVLKRGGDIKAKAYTSPRFQIVMRFGKEDRDLVDEYLSIDEGHNTRTIVKALKPENGSRTLNDTFGVFKKIVLPEV